MANPKGFDAPSSVKAVDESGNLTLAYVAWINRVNIICQAAQQAGTTADRPDSVLYIGRQYYDTTLNKPVYVSAVNPTVWRDAAGTIV